MTPTPTYRERLTAPLWLWFAGLVASGTLGIAYAAPFTAAIGMLTFAIAFSVISIALTWTAPLVQVVDGTLYAGEANLPLINVGTVTPLDAESAARLRGIDADPFAWMLLRGWIGQAVRINVDDASDDTPYWYVSTRRPHELARALEPRSEAGERRKAGGEDDADASR